MKKINPELVMYKVVRNFAITLAILAGVYAVLAAIVAVMSVFDNSGTRAVLNYALSTVGASGICIWFSLQAYEANYTYKDCKKAAEIEAEGQKKQSALVRRQICEKDI